MNLADILYVNRRAVFNFEDDVLDIGDTFEIAAATHEILRGRDLKGFAAHVAIARFHTCDDFTQRDAVREQRVRIEIDLVFLYETPNRRDFGNAFHGFECVTQIPVLNRSQLRQIELSGVINERVLVNPTYAGRVRTDHGIYALRKRTANRVEIFEDA